MGDALRDRLFKTIYLLNDFYTLINETVRPYAIPTLNI